MKKNYFFIFFSIFTIILMSFGVKAAEDIPVAPPVPTNNQTNFVFPVLSLEIKDFKLNKDPASYNAGDKIEGSFKLKNNTNYFAQGIYFETAIHRQGLDPKTATLFFLDGSTLYDLSRTTEPINLGPKEEKEITFSHQIFRYFPSGQDYYFMVGISSARQEALAKDFIKISIANPGRIEKFIRLGGQGSRVFGEDKMWFLQEGAVFEYDKEYQPFKEKEQTFTAEQLEKMPKEMKEQIGKESTALKNQIKATISFRLTGEQIDKPVIKGIIYRYGAPLKEIYNNPIKKWENPLGKDSFGSTILILPLFKDPGAYEAIVQFFDDEEKISNPLVIRYITSGDSGLIYNFLVEQKDEKNYILNVIPVGPVDAAVRDKEKDIPAQLVFSAKEEKTNKICLEKAFDINLKGAKPVQESFVLENCSMPYIFEAQLKKDGKILDEQSQKISTPVSVSKFAKNLWIGILILVLILIGLAYLMFKKSKKQNTPSVPGISIFFIVFLASLFLFGGFQNVRAQVFSPPNLISPSNNSELSASTNFRWSRPANFTPGTTNCGWVQHCYYWEACYYTWECNASWYELVIKDSGGNTVYDSGVLFSESINLAVLQLFPDPGSYSWQVLARKGQSSTVNITTTYTPTETQSSVVWYFSKVASIPGKIIAGAHTPTAQCESGLNNSWCYYGWCGEQICLSQSCYYFEGYGDCYCTSWECVRLSPKWPWRDDWSNFVFNGAGDSDPSPNRFVNYVSGWAVWRAQDLSIPFSYDASNNYFSVPASASSFSLTMKTNPAPNCGNWGGSGFGGMTAFLVDPSSGNLLRQYSVSPHWLKVYPEQNSIYNFNFSLPALNRNQKYRLIIQDHKLFFGGWNDFGWQSLAYISIDFCYGNCPSPSPSPYLLTVTKSGTGSGTVTSNPVGINCGATCSASYDSGTSVTLTATPAGGSTFAGWSGEGCSGTGTCTVTITQARNVSASFALAPTVTLTVNGVRPQIKIAEGWSVNFNWEQEGGPATHCVGSVTTPNGQLNGAEGWNDNDPPKPINDSSPNYTYTLTDQNIYTFTIECFGPGGSAQSSIMVDVIRPILTVSRGSSNCLVSNINWSWNDNDLDNYYRAYTVWYSENENGPFLEIRDENDPDRLSKTYRKNGPFPSGKPYYYKIKSIPEDSSWPVVESNILKIIPCPSLPKWQEIRPR